MEIRSATIEDYPAMALISGEIGQLHHEAHPSLLTPQALPESAFRKALDDPNSDVVVCVVADEIAGIMIYEIVDQPDTHYIYANRSLVISEFGVAEKHRRKGCGEMLINAAVEAAQARGIGRITLRVWAFNEGARAFYERMGFAPLSISMERKIS